MTVGVTGNGSSGAYGVPSGGQGLQDVGHADGQAADLELAIDVRLCPAFDAPIVVVDDDDSPLDALLGDGVAVAYVAAHAHLGQIQDGGRPLAVQNRDRFWKGRSIGRARRRIRVEDVFVWRQVGDAKIPTGIGVCTHPRLALRVVNADPTPVHRRRAARLIEVALNAAGSHRRGDLAHNGGLGRAQGPSDPYKAGQQGQGQPQCPQSTGP